MNERGDKRGRARRRARRGRARRRARRGRRAAVRVVLLMWPALGWATIFAALAAGGAENLYRSVWRFIHELEEQIMHTNVNPEAALGVMGLLWTGFALFVLGLVFLHARWRRKPGRARASAAAGLCVLLLCVGAMLALNEADAPTRLITGHENSLLHKQAKFRLSPSAGWQESVEERPRA